MRSARAPASLLSAGVAAWVAVVGCAPGTAGPVASPLPPAGNLAVVLEGKLQFPYSPGAVDIAVDGALVSHGEAKVVAVPAGEHVVRVVARVDYRCGLFGPSSTVELRAAWVLRLGAGGGRVDLTLRAQDHPSLGFAERLSVRAKPSGAAAFADAVYTVWSQTLVTDDRCGFEREMEPLPPGQGSPQGAPHWSGASFRK